MKHFVLFLLMTFTAVVNAQDIVGKWETFDDKTKEKKALVDIYESNGLYYAKIIDKYVGDPNSRCEKCEGAKKDKPIIGLVIIEDLKKDDDEYNDGTILDPESGDVYSCYLKLVDDNKLKVRGFLGVSILGRTQYWIRKQ